MITSGTTTIRTWGLISLVLCLLITTQAVATVFITVDEALKLVFPACTIERSTIFLTDEQITQAEELAGLKLPSAIVHPYVARRDGMLVGIAYFDAHVVRTLPQTIMVIVDAEDKLVRIEVLSFNEPPDYIPNRIWYHQFVGRRLDEELALKRSIRHVIGATLTARATTEAVRRVLAINHILRDRINP